MIVLNRKLILKSFLIASALCTLYVGIIANIVPVKIANLKIIDSIFMLGSKVRGSAKELEKAAVIAVDDESMRRIDLRWPWPRAVTAKIVENISGRKPSLILLDFIFIGESKMRGSDELLAGALKGAGNVFIASYFGNDGRYVVPEEDIAKSAAGFGFINKPIDRDGAVRRMRPFILSTSGRIIDYSISIKAAAYLMDKKPEDAVSGLSVLKDNTAYVNFINPSSLLVIPAWKALAGGEELKALKGKMVFMGVTSGIFHDIYSTPFGKMAGVIINLNEAITYINNACFSYINKPTSILLLLALLFVAILCNLTLPPARAAFASLAEITLFYTGIVILFLHRVILPDVFGGILMIAVTTMSLHGTKYVAALIDNSKLKKEAVTDGLTGLYTHRFFELKLKVEFVKAMFHDSKLALLIFDLDHFKEINDNYGHEFGNKVLKHLAKIMKDSTKKNNVVARYGGEEFCVVAPDTGKDEAEVYAHRIRNMLKGADILSDKQEPANVTISCGIAVFDRDSFRIYEDMVKAADAALYRSKNTGRDRVSVFDPKIDKYA